jgi:hypothetical protein
MSYRQENQEIQSYFESQKRTHAIHKLEININDLNLKQVRFYFNRIELTFHFTKETFNFFKLGRSAL